MENSSSWSRSDYMWTQGQTWEINSYNKSQQVALFLNFILEEYICLRLDTTNFIIVSNYKVN